MLEKAILIATYAHKGQVDKGGNPYILHPLRLMLCCKNEIERICAVLHDVIEDTHITLDYLRNEGFSEEVLSALDDLTRRRDETYNEFISRITENMVACHVKLLDLSDNMNLSRIENPTQKDHERVEKYREASRRIIEVLEAYEDKEYINTKLIEVNGCVSVRENCTADEFLDKFLDFIENNHWTFGGGIKPGE